MTKYEQLVAAVTGLKTSKEAREAAEVAEANAAATLQEVTNTANQQIQDARAAREQRRAEAQAAKDKVAADLATLNSLAQEFATDTNPEGLDEEESTEPANLATAGTK